jgi:hypothetical protein
MPFRYWKLCKKDEQGTYSNAIDEKVNNLIAKTQGKG